jgi:hypothetical protein
MTAYNVGPVKFGGVSQVTATRGANDPDLGARCQEGACEYIYVYNDGNSQALVGQAVVLQSGASGYSVTISSVTSADLAIGVVRNATLTTGAYGWVVTKGITYVKMGASSGSVAVNGLIQIADNGLFVPASNATGSKALGCGKALEAIASSATGIAHVNLF